VSRLPRHVPIALLTSLVLAVGVGVGVGWWYLTRPPENEGRFINRLRTIDNNWVEIEVYSPQPFPVRNAPMYMWIGGEQIFFGGFFRPDSRFVAFRLAPEQFAHIQTGDLVRITYGVSGDGWAFGTIDKGRLDKGPILP
jgi:hypothetical protein